MSLVCQKELLSAKLIGDIERFVPSEEMHKSLPYLRRVGHQVSMQLHDRCRNRSRHAITEDYEVLDRQLCVSFPKELSNCVK